MVENQQTKIMGRQRIGDVLLAKGVINDSQLDQAAMTQRLLTRIGQRKLIGDILLEYGMVNKLDIDQAARESGSELNLRDNPITDHVLSTLGVAIYGFSNGIAYYDGKLLTETDKKVVFEHLAKKLDKQILDVRRAPLDNQARSKSTYSAIRQELGVVEDLQDRAVVFSQDTDNGDLLKSLFDTMLSAAAIVNASDIRVVYHRYLDVYNWIRFRIEGQYHDIALLTSEACRLLMSKIKMTGGMDFSDHHRPQDGRYSYNSGSIRVNFRISAMPNSDGEAISMRLLKSDSGVNLKKAFGYFPDIYDFIQKMVNPKIGKPNGIFLVSGATGSGKSTTLASVIENLDRRALNVVSIEDPVEIKIANVTQTQVNTAVGLNFAAAIRSFMRQDIDVAMVGEIRDSETANAGLQLSETGHLLLSTVHTSSAIETLNRITGILSGDYKLNGVYVLASQIKGIINQKLIPRVCPHCGTSHEEHDHDEFHEIKDRLLEGGYLNEARLARLHHAKVGVGCDKCKGRRFLGRVLLPDFLGFDEDEEMRAHLLKYLMGQDGDFRNVLKFKSARYLPREEAAFELLMQGAITLDQFEGVCLTSSGGGH